MGSSRTLQTPELILGAALVTLFTMRNGNVRNGFGMSYDFTELMPPMRSTADGSSEGIGNFSEPGFDGYYAQ